MRLFKRSHKAIEQEKISVGEFAHVHKNLIVIVADPEDDTIFCAYNDRIVSGRIRTEAGQDARIIRDMMSTSNFFDSNIDRFLLSLVDVLRIKRMSFGVNNFMQYLDGVLYNISMSHRKKSAQGGPKSGVVKSPVQVADIGRSG